MTKSRPPLYARHRFPAEVINLAVGLYFRFQQQALVRHNCGSAPLSCGQFQAIEGALAEGVRQETEGWLLLLTPRRP